MKPLLLAVALLFMVPGAAAGFEDEIDIRTRSIDSYTVNLDGAAAGNLVTRNITMDQPYSYEHIQHTVIVRITMTAMFFENSDGVWIYTVANESGDIEDCEWELETTTVGGFLAGEATKYAHYGVVCLFRESTTAFPHDHTFILNRTLLSGTPQPPTHESFGIYFESEDVIILNQPTNFEELTGATGAEFLLFIAVLAVTVILWSRSNDPVVQLFSGVLTMLFGAIAISLYASWIGWVPFGAGLAVLGAYFIVRSAIEGLTSR